MKRIATILITLSIIMLTLTAYADNNEHSSGRFSYRLKGNGTAVITEYRGTGDTGDIYVPRQIDGYTVSEIGAHAFSYSDASLDNPRGRAVTVVLPDTISVIGEKAFFCSLITSITIPKSVKLIETGAFAGCCNLSFFSVEKGNEVYTTIDGILYNKKTKELVSFPRRSDANLSSSKVTIPNGIKKIGDYAFYGIPIYNSSLLNFPDSVLSIGDYAFYEAGIVNKRWVSLNKIESIGNYAFASINAKFVDFYMDSIVSIGNNAFEGAEMHSALNQLYFPETLKIIGECAFKDVKIYNYESNRYAKFINGIKKIDLSKTKIEVVPKYAFYNFEAYESDTVVVSFPSTLKEIGSHAFSRDPKNAMNRGYIEIVLPNSVRVISEEAFSNSRLDLQFGNKSELKEIGNRAFFNTRLVVNDGRFILPNGIEKIGDEVFLSTGISELEIPSSTTSIGFNIVDRSNTKIIAEPGSAADLYASENGYAYAEEDDTDWLNE
ncbi:MAG: leucine-rich repeat protein [Clostridia bacterium]|nr:leucine-rich repeat protein [Clostridia bacterium]